MSHGGDSGCNDGCEDAVEVWDGNVGKFSPHPLRSHTQVWSIFPSLIVATLSVFSCVDASLVIPENDLFSSDLGM